MSVEVKTFGCRLNTYESEVIKKMAAENNMDNVVIFNSCAVTKEAERQLRQSIRKTRKEKPDAKIVVTGCSAQVNPDVYTAMDEVDSVVGNEEKLHNDTYEQLAKNQDDGKILADIMEVKQTAPQLVDGFEGRVRGYLQVQNGCNHRCTFCIIPYGRGNSRSVPVASVVQQAKQLVKNGYKELVLTGVDISSYGEDLPATPSLGQMVRRLLSNVPELERLRISSIDMAEIDDDLLDLLENDKRIMPHLHLSLQAGDNMILKRMKRRHSRENALDFIAKLRKAQPNIVLGADIIAGFPTETEEMFQNTYNFIKEANITYLHVFPYSEREGTPASRMPQVEKQVRKKRAEKLRLLADDLLQKYQASLIGKTVSAIVESNNICRAPDYSQIKINDELSLGQEVEIRVVSVENNMLVGKLIK